VVLEHLFTSEKVGKNVFMACFAGALTSIVGIMLARLLFGANSGIASVMFTSILLIPLMRNLFSKQEKIEELEKDFSLRKLIVDNKQILVTYIGLFVGVFITYYFVSFVGVLLGINVISILKEQLFMDAGLIGASSSIGQFFSILEHNWWVLIASFLLSVAAGSGGGLFVVWNLSTWAAIFGYRAAAASFVLGTNPLISASVIQGLTLPHTIFEGLAYIVASLAGAVISMYVVNSKKKMIIFVLAFIGMIMGFFVLKAVLGMFIGGIILTMSLMLIFFVLVSFLKYTFKNEKHRIVYKYNYYLLLGALALFIIGALVEGILLQSSDLLNKYYSAAYIYATIR